MALVKVHKISRQLTPQAGIADTLAAQGVWAEQVLETTADEVIGPVVALLVLVDPFNDKDFTLEEVGTDVVVAETVPHAFVGLAVTQAQRAFAPFNTSTAVVPGHALSTDN